MAKTWGGVAQTASPEWSTEPAGLGLNFNIGQVLSLCRRSANLLTKVANSLDEKHLTRHIVRGINELLKHFDAPETPTNAVTMGQPGNNLLPSEPLGMMNGVGSGLESMDGFNMYNMIGSYGLW